MSRDRQPRFGTYAGAPAVFMRLQDGSEAVTTPEGLAAVQAAGCAGSWLVNSSGLQKPSYVRTQRPSVEGTPKRLRSVAALIAGADRDQQTGYVNGNRLDLRPCNLFLVERRGRRGPAVIPEGGDW